MEECDGLEAVLGDDLIELEQGVGDKRKLKEPLPWPGWDKDGTWIGLTPDQIGSILNAAQENKLATLYPHVPVLCTWPSCTPSDAEAMTTTYSLPKDAANFGVELEKGVFAPRYFIRWKLCLQNTPLRSHDTMQY
jgi:hypothetical protein